MFKKDADAVGQAVDGIICHCATSKIGFLGDSREVRKSESREEVAVAVAVAVGARVL